MSGKFIYIYIYIYIYIVSSSKLRFDQKQGAFTKSETILLRLQLFRYFVPLQTPQNMNIFCGLV